MRPKSMRTVQQSAHYKAGQHAAGTRCGESTGMIRDNKDKLPAESDALLGPWTKCAPRVAKRMEELGRHGSIRWLIRSPARRTCSRLPAKKRRSGTRCGLARSRSTSSARNGNRDRRSGWRVSDPRPQQRAGQRRRAENENVVWQRGLGDGLGPACDHRQFGVLTNPMPRSPGPAGRRGETGSRVRGRRRRPPRVYSQRQW